MQTPINLMTDFGDLVPDALWARLAGALQSFRSRKCYGCVALAQSGLSDPADGGVRRAGQMRDLRKLELAYQVFAAFSFYLRKD